MPLTPLERMHHEASCRLAGERQEAEKGQEFPPLLSASSLSLYAAADIRNTRLIMGLFQNRKEERPPPLRRRA